MYRTYKGLPILTREEFYKWANRQKSFDRLYQGYKDSGYNISLSPSIDRINPKDGYVLGNMRWIKHWDNCRLGREARWAKHKKEKAAKTSQPT